MTSFDKKPRKNAKKKLTYSLFINVIYFIELRAYFYIFSGIYYGMVNSSQVQ